MVRAKGLGAVRDHRHREHHEYDRNQPRRCSKTCPASVNIIRIDTLENLCRAAADLASKRVFQPRFDVRHRLRRAADLAGHGEKLVGERGAQVDERTNYLIVEATPNNLVQVEAVLKELTSKPIRC